MKRSVMMVAAILAVGGMPVAGWAAAKHKDDVVQAMPQDFQQVGQSHFSKWGFSVYDAVLRAPGGKYDALQPFSLTLTYKLSLKGAKIAAQANKEMAAQGVPEDRRDAWEAELAKLIPNVKKGDTLTGVHGDDGSLTLLKNGEKLGLIKDRALSRAFFDIWLGAKTTEPAQRQKLLGEG